MKNTGRYFYKPIILILVSIIECTLYDFLKKIQEHNYEKVPNLDQESIQLIQNTQLPNRLSNFNDICNKYNLLSPILYQKIKASVSIRNRFHIQNEKQQEPKDEAALWTLEQVNGCGKLLKEIYGLMCEKYPRPDKFHMSPSQSDFPEPWVLLI